MVAADVVVERSRSRSPLRVSANTDCHVNGKRDEHVNGSVDTNGVTAKPTGFTKGDIVQYFHMADPAAKYAMYRCPTPIAGRGPRLLQSHGWVDAEITEDFKPENYDIQKRETWPCLQPRRTVQFADRNSGKSGMTLGPRRTLLDHVRRPTTTRPLFSLLFVRWGGDDPVTGPNPNERNDGDWGVYGCPASDDYMSAVVAKGVFRHPRLVGESAKELNFEIFSLFVRNSAEVEAVGREARWMRTMFTGEKCSAFWMMWPAEWEDCRGSDYAAYIERTVLVNAMRGVEAVGIRTGFPHPADQYELITSKSWMATLSLQPLARLPAATMVSKAFVLTNPTRAARQALGALEYIRAANPFPAPEGRKGPSAVNKDGITKGVVKLGWSWEARYVTIWHNEEDLAVKLAEMMNQPGCLASSCVVQEWVDFDYEMRLYFLPPPEWSPGAKLEPVRVECNAWSGSMENGSRRAFHKLSKGDVLSSYWNDDEEAYEKAKREAIDISQYLLAWLRLSEAEPVPMIRLDFMLYRLGPGTVQVCFGEFCEMGACCLGWDEGPPTIWRAALDAALL